MSEYHVVRADGSGTIASFDRWGEPVRKAWHAAAKKCAVNLLALRSCGCLYRALVREHTRQRWKLIKGQPVKGRRKHVRQHTGWRRIEACVEHRRQRGK